MPNDLTCDCGKPGLNSRTLVMHQKSKTHQDWEAMQKDNPDELPADLQAAIDAVDDNPLDRAKMVRAAFAARGWPNTQNPMTVRQFMEKHDIPIIDIPRHMENGVANALRAQRVKEALLGN